jgi:hypothetical protein
VRRAAEARHAIAMQGEPRAGGLPTSLCQSHGTERRPPGQGVLGTFDSLNPFIIKGLPPQGIRAPGQRRQRNHRLCCLKV